MKKLVVMLSLILSCSCPHPDTSLISPKTIGVHNLFMGLGHLNPELSPASEDVVLIITRNARELTDCLKPAQGTWSVYSRHLGIAPLENGRTLGIWTGPNIDAPQRPKWVMDQLWPSPKAALVEKIELLGVSWLVAIVHKHKELQVGLRIREIAIEGNLLKVMMGGLPRYAHQDVEQEGNAFVHLCYTDPIQSNRGEPAYYDNYWPERVEVYTNGKRGYPGLPLRIRLGSEFLKGHEPVLKAEKE